MKDRLIKKLIRLNCPNEYELDIKCRNCCPIDQMKKCWDEVFEKYELLVSEESIYRYQYHEISFAFKKKTNETQ